MARNSELKIAEGKFISSIEPDDYYEYREKTGVLMNYNVAVLISTYNGAKYIEEQINSILNQKECNVKIIARDDGSTDNTLKILEKYTKEGKLKYFSGENLGPALSFITLIKNVPETQYYAFSDQDDIWDNDKLLKGIESLRKIENKPALYCSNLRTVSADEKVLNERKLPDTIELDFRQLLINTGEFFGCTMIFNKKMVDFVKDRDVPKYLVMHDWWLVLIASFYDGLIYDPDPSISYRVHENNYTGQKYNKIENIKKHLKELFVKAPDYPARQAKELIYYLGTSELEKKDLLHYCDLIANYNQSICNKIRLCNLVRKLNMESKWRNFLILRILFNKY